MKIGESSVLSTDDLSIRTGDKADVRIGWSEDGLL